MRSLTLCYSGTPELPVYLAKASHPRPQNTDSNQPPSAAQAISYVNIDHHGLHHAVHHAVQHQPPAVLQPVLQPVLEPPTHQLFNKDFVGSDVDPGPLPALDHHQHHQAAPHQYLEDDQHQGLYQKGIHFTGGADTGVFGG